MEDPAVGEEFAGGVDDGQEQEEWSHGFSLFLEKVY
jgi:hypothetical protein